MLRIVQLKPKENSFYELSKIVKKGIDAIILCEGKRDVNVLKGILLKFFEDLDKVVAIADCESKDSVMDFAKDVVVLSSMSRRLKTIAVVIDADEYTPEKRAESVKNSMQSITGSPVELAEINESDDMFELKSQKFNTKAFVKIADDFSLPYEKHTIDDLVLQLLFLEGKADKNSMDAFRTAKEFVNEVVECDRISIKELILNSKSENVERSFHNIIDYLKNVTEN